MAETKHRHMSLGWEPGDTLEGGPFISDVAPVVASPVIARNVARPSILEAVLEGGADHTGTVTITGTVDGYVGATEVLTFVGPGTVQLRQKTTKRFTDITDIATTGLVGEGPDPTFGLRTAPHIDMRYMTESLKGDHKTFDNSDNVDERHATEIATGVYDYGGDFDSNARPEGGLGELLTATYGAPVESKAEDGPAVALTAAIVPSRKIAIKVTAGTGAGTYTIAGEVDGNADTEIISADLDVLGTPVTLSSTKVWSKVNTITPAGFAGNAETFHEGHAVRHSWKPRDTLPAFHLRKGIDGLAVRESQGMRVEQLELGIKSNSFIVAKISAKGRKDVELPIEVPAFDQVKPFVFHQTTVTRDGSPFNLMMEGILTEKNTLNARDARDGTRFICDLEVEGGESTLKLKTKFKTLEEYRRFWGSTSAREPAAVLTPQAWVFTIDSHEEAYAGNPYSLVINVHQGYVHKHSEAVSKRDAIEGDGELKLIRDATEGATVTLELVNGVAAY